MGQGYEIHNATTKKRSKIKKNFYGTFLHGIFENDPFRTKILRTINPNYKGYNFKKFKKEAIDNYATHIDNHLNMDFIYNTLEKNRC
jgi:adenosylcobyric acid synthase